MRCVALNLTGKFHTVRLNFLFRTGYDRLLFLFGVIFFLCRLKDIGVYVTLFAIGHSTTLVFGLFHGFGLATKILEFQLSPDGLVPNLLASHREF